MQLPPCLPDRFALDGVALAADPGARRLPIAHARGQTDDFEAHAIVEDDVAHPKLKRKHELLSGCAQPKPSLAYADGTKSKALEATNAAEVRVRTIDAARRRMMLIIALIG